MYGFIYCLSERMIKMADGEVRVEITGDNSDLKKNLADSKASVNAAASQMNNLESSINSTN